MSFFTISLTFQTASYIVRQADEDLYEKLKVGEFCYVLSSRQMGKSSLRVQTMAKLQAEGIRCAEIDITMIGSEQVTPEVWYGGIVSYLVSRFRLKVNEGTWWRDRCYLSPVQRLSKFIDEVLLAELSQSIVIFIDEIDNVLSLNFRIDDFFALIRACYNQRVDNPAYKRLTFVLLGVATPPDLIQDKNRTPFNIGHSIQLNGFQWHEAQPLIQGLLGRVSNPEVVLKEVLNWTGGQPFLTQKLCHLISTSPSLVPASSEAELIEDLVRSRVIENWESKDEPEHLRTIRNRLLNNDQKAGRLLGLCQQISQQGEVVADESPEQVELQLSGLVVKRQGKLKLYNRIYREVFNSDWVEKQLSSLRPYSQQLDAWVASQQGDDSRLLRGQALQDALAWAKGKDLSSLDYQFFNASEALNWREEKLVFQAERSKEVEARLAEEQKRLAQEKKTARQQRFFLGIVTLALVIASGLGLGFRYQYRQATLNELKAIITSSEALFASNKLLDALIEAIKAEKKLQELGNVDVDKETKDRVKLVLQQAVYNVKEYNHLSHETGVKGVAFSPDGKIIASASEGYTIKLWNLDGKLIQDPILLGSPSYEITGIAFSPDSKKMVSASADKTVRLWKLKGKSWEEDPTWRKNFRASDKEIAGVTFSPNGKMIASANTDTTVKLWNLDGTEGGTFEGHTGPVEEVSFSPNDEMIASASWDNTIKTWSLDGKAYKNKTLKEHTDEVRGVSFSPDGTMIASASKDTTVKLWNLTNGKVITLKGHSAPVYGVSFSPDGKTIASASADTTVKLWNLNGEEIDTFRGHSDRVWGVSFSPDGKTIASASWDKTVRLWKIKNDFKTLLRGHSDVVIGVDFSSKGQEIASVSDDETVKLWSSEGTLLRTLGKHEAEVYGVSISPNGETIASGSADETVKLWNRESGDTKTLGKHEGEVWRVSFSPDGKTIASASTDKTVKLWNSASGKELKTLPGHTGPIFGVSFSPDGKTIASASWDNTIKLWNPANGEELKTLPGHTGRVWDVAMSKDGKVASASADKTVKLWNADGTFKDLRGHSSDVVAVAVSLDGQTIASASWDKTVKLWNANGSLIKTLKGHSGQVWGVSFSSDGTWLASASEDKTIILWRLKEIKQLDELKYACNWVKNYLAENNDPSLCNGITSEKRFDPKE